MGVQGSRARLAGMLAGGVWFRVVHVAVILSRASCGHFGMVDETAAHVQGSEGP